MNLNASTAVMGSFLVMAAPAFAQVEGFHDPEPKW